MFSLFIIEDNVLADEGALDADQIYIENIESEDVEVSDPMTFEQIVLEYAQDTNTTYTEALESFKANTSLLSTSALFAANDSYRTISKRLYVTSSYKPQLKYYCRTSEYGSSWHGIVEILKVSMDRGYNGTSYAFDGDIYTHLRNANQIFFIVNGDFYDNASSTLSAGLNIGVGVESSVSFSASYRKDHYKYVYIEDYLNW